MALINLSAVQAYCVAEDGEELGKPATQVGEAKAHDDNVSCRHKQPHHDVILGEWPLVLFHQFQLHRFLSISDHCISCFFAVRAAPD